MNDAPDAPEAHEVGALDLAAWLRDERLTQCEHAGEFGPLCCSPCLRDRLLASDWLAQHDIALAVDAEGEVARLRAENKALRITVAKTMQFRGERDNQRARADAAEARLAEVAQALAGHPRCERHPDDDSISCGWKSAVASVQAVLDSETVAPADEAVDHE